MKKICFATSLFIGATCLASCGGVSIDEAGWKKAFSPENFTNCWIIYSETTNERLQGGYTQVRFDGSKSYYSLYTLSDEKDESGDYIHEYVSEIFYEVDSGSKEWEYDLNIATGEYTKKEAEVNLAKDFLNKMCDHFKDEYANFTLDGDYYEKMLGASEREVVRFFEGKLNIIQWSDRTNSQKRLAYSYSFGFGKTTITIPSVK